MPAKRDFNFEGVQLETTIVVAFYLICCIFETESQIGISKFMLV